MIETGGGGGGGSHSFRLLDNPVVVVVDIYPEGTYARDQQREGSTATEKCLISNAETDVSPL